MSRWPGLTLHCHKPMQHLLTSWAMCGSASWPTASDQTQREMRDAGVQVLCLDGVPRDGDAGPQPRRMHLQQLGRCLEGADRQMRMRATGGCSHPVASGWSTLQPLPLSPAPVAIPDVPEVSVAVPGKSRLCSRAHAHGARGRTLADVHRAWCCSKLRLAVCLPWPA